jgi:hypothetical protein
MKLREVVGGAICVASFFGLLYCAVQRGLICTSMPKYDESAGRTTQFRCKYETRKAFVTARRARFLRYSPLVFIAGMALGGLVFGGIEGSGRRG